MCEAGCVVMRCNDPILPCCVRRMQVRYPVPCSERYFGCTGDGLSAVAMHVSEAEAARIVVQDTRELRPLEARRLVRPYVRKRKRMKEAEEAEARMRTRAINGTNANATAAAVTALTAPASEASERLRKHRPRRRFWREIQSKLSIG